MQGGRVPSRIRRTREEGKTMFKAIGRSVWNFVADDSGPTAVEYAVMLALIIVVCIAAVRVLGTNASGTFNSVGTAIGS
jgi:pilus assembly protein Flp/PilA